MNVTLKYFSWLPRASQNFYVGNLTDKANGKNKNNYSNEMINLKGNRLV